MATLLTSARSGVTWSTPAAIRGLICGIPASVVGLTDIRFGAVLAIGVIPAVILPLPPRRRQRVATPVLGGLVGISLLAGAQLGRVPWLAVVSLLGLAVLASMAATGGRRGMLALTLCLPLCAIGFSYPGWTPAVWLALLLEAGSLYAWLVSLAWPETTTPVTNLAPVLPDRRAMLRYGMQVGVVGAVLTAVGFLAGFDHVGWAPAAALLVMRPSMIVQHTRSVGRVASVVTGSLVAIACIEIPAPTPVIAGLIALAIAMAAGTAASRWYLTSAFTTFLVFLLLVSDHPADAVGRFWERTGETLLGVSFAFAVVVLSRPRNRDGRL